MGDSPLWDEIDIEAVEDKLSAADTNKGYLQRELLKRLNVHVREGTIPTDGHFLFYELEQRGVVSKNPPPGKVRTPRQDLTDALTFLSEKGIVPWWWIEDGSRDYTKFKTRPTVGEYVSDSVNSAAIDRWGGKPAPLILCESQAVHAAAFDTAALYACPIAHTSGQARRHLINRVAPNLSGSQRVLYLGDLDLSGGQIEEHTRKTLIEHSFFGQASSVLVRRQWEQMIRSNWERLALTEAQVNADPRLRGLIIRKVDRRFKPPRSFDAVELEALGQRRIVELVRARLDQLMLDMTGEPIDAVLVRQDEQREQVAEQLRGVVGDDR